MNNLANFFHDSFDILIDSNRQVMDEACRLRYQVCGLETGFGNRTAFADGRECDPFDTNSVHGIIQHRDSGTSMATVRLMIRPSGEPGGPFPGRASFPGPAGGKRHHRSSSAETFIGGNLQIRGL